MTPRCRRSSRRKGAKAPSRLTMRQAPNAIGSVTAGPSPCRWRRRHRHRPGRCRDVAAAAISWPHVGGIVIRDRSRRAWRDIGAAVRTQSWLWPGTRARRHRHRCRRRCRFKPLQFLPIELVGHVVAALGHCRRPTSVRTRGRRVGTRLVRRSAVPGAPRTSVLALKPAPQSPAPSGWQCRSIDVSCDCSPLRFCWTIRQEAAEPDRRLRT